jgi:hybrid cluster-associated redox disulfide protein
VTHVDAKIRKKKKNKYGKMKGKINKKMTFAEVMKKYPETAEIFIEEGLHCIGCPMAMMETIEDGCKAHDINADKLIKKLNKKLKK